AVVRFEATDRGACRGQQAPDLLGDGLEEILRGCALSDKRRDTPQRGLLLGEHRSCLSRLGVGGRGGYQFWEGADTGLGVFGPRPDLASRGHQRAPQLPLDDDRRPDGRAYAQSPRKIRCRTLPGLVVAVHSRGRAALEDTSGEVVAVQWKP